MVDLITPDTIHFEARISEDELRRRMELEVLEQINGIDESGRRRDGLSVKTARGTHGGYVISVSGPAPARIMLPAPKAGE